MRNRKIIYIIKAIPPIELAHAKTVNPKNTELTPDNICTSSTKLMSTEHTTVNALTDIMKEYIVNTFMNCGYCFRTMQYMV